MTNTETISPLNYRIKENTWFTRGRIGGAYYNDFGWGNGYVALPPGHPCFGVHYDEIDVDVHGGLTYAKMEGENWVVGFDTAHLDDTLERWSREAVEQETLRLKEQLENYQQRTIEQNATLQS